MCALPLQVKPGDLIFVAGAGGGVGQLITAKLLDVRSYPMWEVPD